MENLGLLFDGVPIVVKGVKYIVPPLSFGQVEELAEVIDKVSKPGPLNKEMINNTAIVVHAALSRNYPDMPIEFVKNNLLDMRTVKTIVPYVFAQSGLVESQGEGTGESEPVA